MLNNHLFLFEPTPDGGDGNGGGSDDTTDDDTGAGAAASVAVSAVATRATSGGSDSGGDPRLPQMPASGSGDLADYLLVGSGASGGQGDGERLLGRRGECPRPLEHDECRVAFIEMTDIRRYTHCPQYPPATNAQQNFLRQAVFRVTAV